MGVQLGVAIFSAVLGMFQFGFNTGVINAPQSSIETFINVSFKSRYDVDVTSEKIKTLFSIAVSICLVGGMIGGLTGGSLAHKFGPKKGLLYVQVLSLVGAICMGICKPASSYELLLIGRFLSGLSCGAFTGLVPLYITEIAPVHLRGGLGTVNQLAVTFGIFISMILGLGNIFGNDTLWPLLLALIGVPSLIQVILLPMVPESPKYLIITKGDLIGGKKALAKLRGGSIDEIEEEADEISKEGGDQDDSKNRLSVVALLRTSSLYLPLFVVICMHLSQQLSGMVAIFYYSTSFFEDAGIEKSQAQYATLGVGAIMVGMTLVTIPLMDRAGRRTLHLTGIAGMVVCAILITIAQNVNNNTDRETEISGVGIFLIVSTLAFVVFFAVGPGSIPWLITGEVFEHGARPAAISIAVFVNWTGNLAVGLIFPVMQTRLEEYSFVPFAVILTVLFAILFFYLPETKGLQVFDIVEIFQAPNAWKTPIGFRPKLRRRRSDILIDGTANPTYGTNDHETSKE